MADSPSRIKLIWTSFRAMPAWVQVWVALILAPLNMISLAFLDQPGGVLIACLAVGAMLPGLILVAAERGFSKAISIPHLIFWTPLVIYLAVRLTAGPSADDPLFTLYLWALLIVNAVSLAFDCLDGWRWLRGDRAVAGAQ